MLAPRNELFLFSLATAQYREGKLREALSSYKRCSELNPKKDLYFEKAARTLSQLEGEEAALSLYEQCVRVGDLNNSDNSSSNNSG